MKVWTFVMHTHGLLLEALVRNWAHVMPLMPFGPLKKTNII